MSNRTVFERTGAFACGVPDVQDGISDRDRAVVELAQRLAEKRRQVAC
jgi:hypothetical protein